MVHGNLVLTTRCGRVWLDSHRSGASRQSVVTTLKCARLTGHPSRYAARIRCTRLYRRSVADAPRSPLRALSSYWRVFGRHSGLHWPSFEPDEVPRRRTKAN